MFAERFRILLNLTLATYTAFVDCFFPNAYPGATEFLVKKVGTLFNNGVAFGSELCEELSTSTGESCIVDETSDGRTERDEDGGDSSHESKPDESVIQ
jgi:hypothetical protein